MNSSSEARELERYRIFSEVRRRGRVTSVQGVANNRDSAVCHCHSYLVHAPGDGMNAIEACRGFGASADQRH